MVSHTWQIELMGLNWACNNKVHKFTGLNWACNKKSTIWQVWIEHATMKSTVWQVWIEHATIKTTVSQTVLSMQQKSPQSDRSELSMQQSSPQSNTCNRSELHMKQFRSELYMKTSTHKTAMFLVQSVHETIQPQFYRSELCIKQQKFRKT